MTELRATKPFNSFPLFLSLCHSLASDCNGCLIVVKLTTQNKFMYYLCSACQVSKKENKFPEPAFRSKSNTKFCTVSGFQETLKYYTNNNEIHPTCTPHSCCLSVGQCSLLLGSTMPNSTVAPHVSISSTQRNHVSSGLCSYPQPSSPLVLLWSQQVANTCKSS